MSVVIKDFEVITDEPPSQTPTEAVSPAPLGLTPEDIEHIFEFFIERRTRLLAD